MSRTATTVEEPADLVLHFADSVAADGMGMNPAVAASVSTAYGTMVHLVPVAGRWLAEHKGRHRSFSATAIGTTAGLIRYAAGRRHLAGRKHSAEYALAPHAMRGAVWGITGGILAFAVFATRLAGLTESDRRLVRDSR